MGSDPRRLGDLDDYLPPPVRWLCTAPAMGLTGHNFDGVDSERHSVQSGNNGYMSKRLCICNDHDFPLTISK